MMHHEDHYGYEFSAVNFRLSTEEEILIYKAKKEVYTDKNKKLKKLYKEIEELKKS